MNRMITPLLMLTLGLFAGETEKTIRTQPVTPAAQPSGPRQSPEDGRQTLPSIDAEAAAIRAMSPEKLTEVITPPAIPRAFTVHIGGCPNCGSEIFKKGRNPWIINRERPFKVQCPNCKRIYPDNDFYGYWKSGFTDKSKLKGEFADDGWGWKNSASSKKYWFVAYYNHWMYHRLLNTTLDAMVENYRITGDREYAERVGYLLWKLSTYWQDYDHNKQARYSTEFDPNYQGRVINAIWETASARISARVYDAILPVLQQDSPLLRQLTGRSMPETRHDIEENLLRQMARDIMNPPGRIRGNFGMHQRALLTIAKVLENTQGTPNSAMMIDWVTSKVTAESRGAITPIDYALYNNLFGDGTPYESPGYSMLWVGHMTGIFSSLADFGRDYFYSWPQLRQLYRWQEKMVVAGRFSPALGDTGNIDAKRLLANVDNNQVAFDRYGTPELAAMLVLTDPSLQGSPEADREQVGDTPETESAKAARRKIRAAAAAADPLLFYRSSHLPGYGFATLQNANRKNPAGLAMIYGFYPAHCHREKLHLEFFAKDAALTPDFGYPDTASNMDPRRYGYFVNTLTHNTVVVDAAMQAHDGGRCTAFDSGKFAQFIEADAAPVYPQTSLYRRAVLTYDRGGGEMVTADFFRVKGGKRHDYFFHGSGPDCRTAAKLSEPRPGTLAGEAVPYGKFYDDPKLRDIEPGSASYADYTGSGYQYLYDIRKASAVTGNPVSFIHPDRDGKIGVTFFPVGDGDEMLLGKGKLQLNRPDPGEVAYLILRRAGEKDLASSFVTVIEPGTIPGAITAVRTLKHEFGATLLQLTFTNGEVHYLYNSLKPLTEPLNADGFTFSGQAGVLMLSPNGDVKKAYVYNHGRIVKDGNVLVEAAAPFVSRIESVDLLKRTLRLAEPVPETYCRGQYLFTDMMSYLPAKIDGADISLGDYSPIRGRGRFTTYNPTTGVGAMIPEPALHRNGMTLYAADGKSAIGPIQRGKRNAIVVGNNRNHPGMRLDPAIGMTEDLWIGEFGPGETVMIKASEAR